MSQSVKQSAGLLMFRYRAGVLEVFLAHPGGPFFAGKDDGVWSIPKGEIEDGEDPFAAARREFSEETGGRPAGTFLPLGSIRQRGGKIVHAWAFEGDFDESQIPPSNTFTIEWPPHSGRRQEFPEIDRVAFFDVEAARHKIHPGQAELIDRLQSRLAEKMK